MDSRIRRFLGPRNPNQLRLDLQIMKHYGDQFELEHKNEIGGLPGKLKLLAYYNADRGPVTIAGARMHFEY